MTIIRAFNQTPAPITSKDMSSAFYRSQNTRFEMVAPNIYMDWNHCEMDLLCLRKSGYIDEVEIKITKADYLADFKKTMSIKVGEKHIGANIFHPRYEDLLKHDLIPTGETKANRFSFLIPESLIDKCDIPDYSGLYVYTEYGSVMEKKEAPLLHKKKISDREKYELGRKMHNRYWSVTV